MKKTVVIFLALMSLSLAAFACGCRLKQSYSFRGVVSQVHEDGFLIKGEANQPIGEAVVSIGRNTKLRFGDNSTAKLSDIFVGGYVEIVYDGTVRDSHPVCIKALRVIILNKTRNLY